MVFDTTTLLAFFDCAAAMSTASAVAVVPSYIEALEMASPVRAVIMLWYSKM